MSCINNIFLAESKKKKKKKKHITPIILNLIAMLGLKQEYKRDIRTGAANHHISSTGFSRGSAKSRIYVKQKGECESSSNWEYTALDYPAFRDIVYKVKSHNNKAKVEKWSEELVQAVSQE